MALQRQDPVSLPESPLAMLEKRVQEKMGEAEQCYLGAALTLRSIFWSSTSKSQLLGVTVPSANCIERGLCGSGNDFGGD